MKEFKEGVFQKGELRIIVSLDAGLWHISISHPSRLPTYEELKEARYVFAPDNIYMAQIFPPQDQFINVHPYCLHLYQLSDVEIKNLNTMATLDYLKGLELIRDSKEVGIQEKITTLLNVLGSLCVKIMSETNAKEINLEAKSENTQSIISVNLKKDE